MIKIENLNKIYPNGIQALFNLNLSIQKNDFVVFVGPSGCGKSSTLRAISGLENISSGKLIINNRLANNYTPKERGISMVFQNYALYPHLSIYKNIRFPLENDKRDLYSFYKNNWLLWKEIKVLYYKFNNETKENIDNFLKINKQIIENKYSLKKLKSKYVSDFLRNRSDFMSKKTKFKASKKIEHDSKEQEVKNDVFKNYKNKKNEIKLLFYKNKKENSDSIRRLKRNLKDSKSIFKKKKDASFNEKDFKKEKEKLIKEKKINRPYLTWRKENHEKVIWAASILGLDKYVYRKPKDLSGGQRQRVALGRAIVRNPSIFLLDEPLSNLDAKLRTSMRETILSIHEKIDAATIYVTHDQVEAMTMATKIVVMKDGFAQQIDEPSTVYNNPSNIFVAGFIGSPEINFFQGILKDNNFVSDELNFKIPGGVLKKMNNYKNKKVILGIRPENISSRPEILDTYKDTKINFKIESKELLGKEVIFYGKINNGEKIRRVILNTSDVFIKDSLLTLGIDKNRLHFFDPENSESINHEKTEETRLALSIWREGKEKRSINKKLLDLEREKIKNKGILKKLLILMKNNYRKKGNNGKN